ncbi:MAG: carbohydrate kinase family protein [Chloroflexota bacterium]
MTELLVIGGASLDILHFAGQTSPSAGGAGMYTALAASRSGVRATMLAPRPSPVPVSLQPVAQRIEWLGPAVAPDELPRFEIAHYGGGKAELLNASWGAEARMTPNDLPADLAGYRLVHIAALGTARRQLDFLHACRQRGATRISVGTYARVVYSETENIRALFDQADIFFMNENEATGLFGSIEVARTRPGALLFITLGERGALVYQGQHVTRIPGLKANELDPTGAGDTFCGATLAGLARGEHPVIAAWKAVALAAQVIEAIGPAALLRDDSPPEVPHDPRVALNQDQIARVARIIATLPEVEPFKFVGPECPPVGHPAALDYYFAATLQQFGFWEARGGRYGRPLLAPIEGAPRKGSDYLWHAYLRPLARDAEFYAPARQASLTRDDLVFIFRADDGSDPMPSLDLHLAQAQAYGHDMLALGLSPQILVARANTTATPLQTFLQSLDHIGGYKEDPLRKKANLLALILHQRPEGFLRFSADEAVDPVIDYHHMRSCLRMGLLDVLDPDLREALIVRRLLDPSDEWAVRRAAWGAIRPIVAGSGKSMGAVDWFFFNARRRCPEMAEPECFQCPVDPVCAHRKELFQPVLRTTFY